MEKPFILGQEIIRPLDSGSMADVYLAREHELKRLVAIKILKQDHSKDEVARRRFEREAQSAARVSHTGVPSIYQVGSLADGTPFIVEEYIDGKNLANLLESVGEIDVEHATWIIRSVAIALQAAHDKGIVHRDVKPANILLENGSDRVVLADFGIAAIGIHGGERSTRLTTAGQKLGDMRYSSPEQLLGEQVTPESDVYSLACVAYELLTGRGPYDDSTRNLVHAHLRQTPIPLCDLRDGVSARLSDTLIRCLAKNPQRRPSATHFLRLLDSPDSELQSDGNIFSVFLSELKRRRVYRVAVGYLATSFVLLEGADLLISASPNRQWLFRVLVFLALAGLPIVLVGAWVFDLRSGRLIRTDPIAGGPHLAAIELIALILIVFASFLLGWWLLYGSASP